MTGLLLWLALLALPAWWLLARTAPPGRGLLRSRIEALLPQTQCRRCGFDGCQPYAEALAWRGAPLNRCPPGGQVLIQRLSQLLGEDPLPLDPECGVEEEPQVAVILEPECIGCTKCIQACPVDAIVGAPKRMHTVILEECTGCALCLPPCPVDCIELRPRRPAALCGT